MSIRSAWISEVLRASAGTGKTYALSSRYLRLIAAGEPPDRILAATFARKAAGEILDRVLARLAAATLDAGERRKLAESLQRPQVSAAECRTWLRGLVSQLHRLRIGTLDGFFNRLAASYGLELGLPPLWRIADDLLDRQMRTAAIGRLLAGQSHADAAALLHLLAKGNVARSVARQIGDIVDRGYELYVESDRAAWHSLARRAPRPPGDLAAAIDRVASLADLPSSIAAAVAKEVELARAGEWAALVDKGVAAKILGGEDTYSRQRIPPHLVAAYEPLLLHAQAELVNQLVNQTETTWNLLAHFDGAYRAAKHEARALRFDDVTGVLARHSAALAGAAAFRLDARIDHLLLDEFQDTSLPQWRVLAPLAQATASSPGSSFFAVGDVKQAIYGWRGGAAEIFEALGQQCPGVAEAPPLVHSRRSCQAVIDTVNRVFGELPRSGVVDKWPAVRDAWRRRFEPHTTAQTGLSGYCRLLVAPAAEPPVTQHDATLDFAAEEVARWATESPHHSIGVLVRTNAAVARVIWRLRAAGVACSEEGGIPLVDSPAVGAVLSLLRLADHPGDTVARFHVARSCLGPLPQIELTAHDDDAAARELARRLRWRLSVEGYGPVLYELSQAIAPWCDARDTSRMAQLVELAYAWQPQATLRADDFVRFVEHTRVEDPSSAQVRAMTIHQAKGLEFDVVVLPELDRNLQPQSPNVVFDRDGPIGPVQRVCRYASGAVQKLLPPEHQAMFARWPDAYVHEALCVLYVGLTRPVHALHMIVGPAKPSERQIPKTAAGVLRETLAPGHAAEPLAVLYEHGDANWAAKSPVPAPIAAAPEAARPVVRLRRAAGPARRGLDRQSPSGLEGGRAVKLGRLLAESPVARQRGTLVHAWLEAVAWIEDGLPSAEQLRAIGAPLADAAVVEHELARWPQVIARPAVTAILSRAAYADPALLGLPAEACRAIAAAPVQLAVRREQSFVCREDDTVLQGAIDRLVEWRRGTRSLAADVVDFKTDLVSTGAEIAERAEFYGPQLSAYRRAAARLLGLSPAHVTARLVFLAPGVVRPVGDGET